jgi:hypothetical protein
MDIEFGGGNQQASMTEQAIPRRLVFHCKNEVGAIERTSRVSSYHKLNLVWREIRERSVEWSVG